MTGFSFPTILSETSVTTAAAQTVYVFVFVFSHTPAFMYVGGYLCLCVRRRLGLFPGIITYYQPLPISPDAAAEMTAQRESCRMTQTHTARQLAWPTQGKLGLCDGGERRAA